MGGMDNDRRTLIRALGSFPFCGASAPCSSDSEAFHANPYANCRVVIHSFRNTIGRGLIGSKCIELCSTRLKLERNLRLVGRGDAWWNSILRAGRAWQLTWLARLATAQGELIFSCWGRISPCTRSISAGLRSSAALHRGRRFCWLIRRAALAHPDRNG